MFLQLLTSEHFRKTWFHVWAGALLTTMFSIGMSVCGPLTWIISTAVFSFLMLLGGFGSTIFARSFFKLAEVGKAVQIAMFLVAGIFSAWITALFFSVMVTDYITVSAFTIAGYILVGYFTGHIKQYSERSWLPVKMPEGE